MRLGKQLPRIAGCTFLPGVQFKYETAQIREAGRALYRHKRNCPCGRRFGLSPAIAVVRPKTVDLRPPLYKGRSPQLRDLEIINVIEKPEKYAPQLTNVDVDKSEMMTTADTKSPFRAGQEYVFLLQVHNTPEKGWIALYPCGALSLNDASLAMAREAATSGAD